MLELPSVFHGQAEVDGYSGTRGALSAEVRQAWGSETSGSGGRREEVSTVSAHEIQGPRFGEGFSFYNLIVTDLGKTLVFVGILIAATGLVLLLLGKTNLPLGRLPGDIVYRGKNTTFYFPLATSILVSVVLSAVLYLLGRMRR